jgi:integrase
MPLTNTAIRNISPRTKAFKLSDQKGMYLLVNKTGKYFRFDYRYGGKRKTLALGVYPDISLAEARKKLEEARRLLENDVDPAQYRKKTKGLKIEQTENGFESIAREWFTKNTHTWTQGHSRTIIRRLEQNAFPWLGGCPIKSITAPELLSVLQRIESRGALETAHRVKQICGQIFRYAIATGRAERDPSADLRGALPPTKPKRMATITDPKQVGELLRAIDTYKGNLITKCALRLAPLVFLRPGELRKSEWQEIDIDNEVWRIPGPRMKMRDPHIVPLSPQSIAVLQEIEPLTGRDRYVFPSLISSQRPMSENTVLGALRRLGYAKEEMSGHGFRAMASTLLHEQGWPTDIIERQLAHAERNKIKAAYNHAQHLSERKRMMIAWADYLDVLKKNSEAA